MPGLREELLRKYQEELSCLRQFAQEFAEEYPKEAGRLRFEPNRCEDPHVERLLEGFALLSARIHLRLDDDFPQISTAVLEALYPHYVRPIPSMSIVQLGLDPEQGPVSTIAKVPKGSVLHSSRINGTQCTFRTAYDTALWPVQITEAVWRSSTHAKFSSKNEDAVAVLKLSLKCFPQTDFHGLYHTPEKDPLQTGKEKERVPALRFFLYGKHANALYELLLNNCCSVTIWDGLREETRHDLSPSCIKAVGFAENEDILPYTRRSFSGYRLLQEYFAFPEKFLFLDLEGLDQLPKGFGPAARIEFAISRFRDPDRHSALERSVSKDTFRLSCTPIVNLFAQGAEPVPLDQTKFEYPVVPDLRRRDLMEVFSIDEVKAQNTLTREIIEFQPFYSFKHAPTPREKIRFWHSTRKEPELGRELPTTVYLSVVDLSGAPVDPEADALFVRCTCTNGNLPSKLPPDYDGTEFQLDGPSAVKKVLALRRPTPALPPPLGKSVFWNLISHLSLNYLSLEDEEGRKSLQEILRLYNFSASEHLNNQIKSISHLRCFRHSAQVSSGGDIWFARGVRVEMELDETQFEDDGVFLFANVLERFLALYVSVNSFSQLQVSLKSRKEVLREWPPRAGNSNLM